MTTRLLSTIAGDFSVEIGFGFVWSDRVYTPWAVSHYQTISGVIDRYKAKKRDGRPITLDGSKAWVDNSFVEAFLVLAEYNDQMFLTWAEDFRKPSATYNVVFQAETPFEFQKVDPDVDYWIAKINLMEKR